VNLQEYIQSGTVEAYVFGVLTPAEKEAFERLLQVSPELQQALITVELQVEQFAAGQAIPPPPETRQQFQDFLQGLPVLRRGIGAPPPREGNGNGHSKTNYIPAFEVSSSHIKVHKHWRIAFLVLFIISKIFLAFLIYYIIKFYDARSQVKQLQQQEQVQKAGK
jgi:hypothetical protein